MAAVIPMLSISQELYHAAGILCNTIYWGIDFKCIECKHGDVEDDSMFHW